MTQYIRKHDVQEYVNHLADTQINDNNRILQRNDRRQTGRGWATEQMVHLPATITVPYANSVPIKRKVPTSNMAVELDATQ